MHERGHQETSSRQTQMAEMRREASDWSRGLFMDDEWMRWLEPVLGGQVVGDGTAEGSWS